MRTRPEPGSAAGRRRRARWLPPLLAVLALHLLVLLMLQGALRSPPRTRPASAPPPLVLVWPKPTLPAAAPQAPPPRDSEPPQQPRTVRRPAPPPAPSAVAEIAAPTASEPGGAGTPAPTAAAPAPDASPPGELLDTEASRRAIREAARQRSTGELGAQATGEKAPVSEQDKMGQEIARGARGDCLKGEYAGSGMGLLSLPFWLIAELREKCRR